MNNAAFNIHDINVSVLAKDGGHNRSLWVNVGMRAPSDWSAVRVYALILALFTAVLSETTANYITAVFCYKSEKHGLNMVRGYL